MCTLGSLLSLRRGMPLGLTIPALASASGFAAASAHADELGGTVFCNSSPASNVLVEALVSDPDTGPTTQVASTTTDAFGGYSFDLSSDYYSLRVTPPIGSVCEPANSHTFFVSGATSFDFVLYQPAGPSDSDGDGVDDAQDVCPGFNDAVDGDADGVPDGCDACFGNDEQADRDADGVCTDLDACVGDDASGDTDLDGICDTADNCPLLPNGEQADADGDGIGDMCEADTDADGTPDDDDNCPFTPNTFQADSDLDSVGDVCDDDDDDDGAPDGSDNCPLIPNGDQADVNGDGLGDACSGDDDADGIFDDQDWCPGTPLDTLIDQFGCSGDQRIRLDCGTSADHDKHGDYVSCVVQSVNASREAGLLTQKQAAVLKRQAARS